MSMIANRPLAAPWSVVEKEHLELTHHEVCTALTVLQSNVELVRIEFRHAQPPGGEEALREHLRELDLAVARLLRLAAQLRSWHAANAPKSVES